MIQRIQTIYLSLITILSLLLYRGGFMAFKDGMGSVYTVTFNGLAKGTDMANIDLIQKLPVISGLIVLLVVISILTMFLFKKRNIQLTLSKILIAIAVVFVLTCSYYAYSVISEYTARMLLVIKTVIPVLILIFSFLAYRGIKKDDDLVKSYDRLR